MSAPIADTLGRVTELLDRVSMDLGILERARVTEARLDFLRTAVTELYLATSTLAGVVAELADLLGARP